MSGKSERRYVVVFGSLSDAGPDQPVRLFQTMPHFMAGESLLFRVKLTESTVIMELKDLIKEKGINATEHAIDTMDLTLWKVGTRMTMASDSTTNSPAG